MNAREILQSIINNFEVTKFEQFCREKNDTFTFPNEHLNINTPDNFEDGRKIGEAKLEDGILIVCSFLANKELRERSGKKAQYDLGKQILKQQQADAGIFIFYDSEGDFRFSLIYTNYLGKRRDWSTFKRFTYFVSKDQTNKTFLKQIGEGDFSTIEKIKEAFSVEKVTKEFYAEIANWYLWAKQNSHFPKDAEADENGRDMAIIRLITRMIFIWFMREEDLVPPILFEAKQIKTILKDITPENSTYYQAILQNLFFATLSTKQEERRFRSEKRYNKGWNEDFTNQYVFRYQDFFINPDLIEDYFSNIPFLNGGLFECLDDGKNNIYIDGFTERKKEYQTQVPNFLFFSNEQMIDLNTYYGTKGKKYKVQGLINILSSYNFTIDENSSDDADIALDPELLGRVFENLLASYDPVTSTTARKATGSYYTPREIVDYMISESLKEYFKNHLDNIKEIDSKLNNLFDSEQKENPFSPQETKNLVQLIDNLRIVDPAVGSGAFPMGALNKMVFILNKIDFGNELWKQAQLRATDAIPDPQIRYSTQKQIEDYFKTKKPDYFRKLYLIQKCIYGVDIQQIAVEIAKLRVFISLLVDEDKNDIQPLPNLDFKIMRGNSLIELISYIKTNDANRNKIVDKLTVLKEDLFNTSNHQEKNDKRQGINRLLVELFDYDRSKTIESLQQDIIRIQSQLRLFEDKQSKKSDERQIEEIKNKINEIKKIKVPGPTKHFDEWHITFSEVFQEKEGFDIVIGNPPYIGEKGHKEIFREVRESRLGQYYYEGKMDYFYFFFHLALDISKDNGIVAFITTNYYLTATGAKKLRQDFKERAAIKKLINFNELKIFENLGEHNMITILQKGKDDNIIVQTCITQRQGIAKPEVLQSILNLNDSETQYYKINQKDLYDGEECYIRLTGVGNSDIVADPIQKILDKIKIQGTVLENLCRINNGIHSEADYLSKKKYNLRNDKDASIGDGIYILNKEVFHDRKIISEISSFPKELSYLKPFFKSSDIHKWFTSIHSEKKIIYLNKKQDNINELPLIKKHLLRFKTIINRSSDNAPYLHRPKTESDFLGPKIVVPQRSPRNTFGYNEIPWYASADVYFITEKDKSISLKYILALLNSKLYYVWLYYRGKRKGEMLELYQKPLSETPLKKIPKGEQQPFIDLVDKILAITKDDDYLQNAEKQAKVKEYEHHIDQSVYKLYGLTKEEIKIIEQSEIK